MTPALRKRTSRRDSEARNLSTAGLMVARLEKSAIKGIRRPRDFGKAAAILEMAW